MGKCPSPFITVSFAPFTRAATASLSRGEADLCGKISTSTTGLTRSWEYWSVRLARAGLMVPEAKAVPKNVRRAAKASSRGARKTPARKKTGRRRN